MKLEINHSPPIILILPTGNAGANEKYDLLVSMDTKDIKDTGFASY